MPNGNVHSGVGSSSGGSFAFLRSKGEEPLHRTIEALGGAFGGRIAAILPDKFDPATSPNHRGVAHSIFVGAFIGCTATRNLDQWQRHLRFLADCQALLKRQAVDNIEYLWHVFLEFFFRFLAGAIAGVVAGYESHLLLDAFTPRSLPLLA
jgi:hypothetical protein